MRLRKKTLIIICLTLIGMILLIYAASQMILTASYTGIENREVRSEINGSLSEINYDLSTLDSVTVDYAYWDDTYSFVKNGGLEGYVQSNFVDATMLNQKLNAIVIINASDQVLYARGYDLKRTEDAPVPEGILASLSAGSPLIRSSATGSLHGIIMLQGGPMLISAYPILKSDGEGASAGTLIMGRFLDDREVGVLRNMSGISIAVHPFSEAGMPPDFEPATGLAASGTDVVIAPVDADTVRGYTLIRDIYGNPALVIRVDEPRTVYQQSQNTLIYIITSLLISGLVFSIVTIFFLEKMVMSPVIRLNESVGRIGLDTDISARVSAGGDDEVAQLAVTINRTLDALEASRQQMLDKEQRLRNLVENLSDMVWEMDVDRRFTYVSPQSMEVVGYEPGDLLGKNPFTLMREGDEGRVIQVIREQITRGEIPVLVEIEISRPDGRMTRLEASGVPIVGPDGKVAGYRGIARDIGERKRAEEALRESEERLRLCAATACFGTFDWDIASDMQVWSPETYEIYGVTQDTPLTRDFMNSLIYPGDQQDAALAAYLDPAGTGDYTMEYRIIRASNGTIRWVSVRARVFYAGKGPERKAVRILGAIQDITDRKRAEEEMAASLQEKEVLLKEIHHRVKNNLQIISSLLSLQSENINSENPASTFRESQDRIRSMALIHEKLYQSKDISRIDFDGYVRSLTSYLSHSYAAGRNVSVAIDIEGVSLGIDTAIPCGLIINELVSNSLKYAFRDGRHGELRIGLVQNHDRYTLTVSDNGVGFPPGLDFRNTPSLGLQLVNTLVGQLEGTIELDSLHGTTFKIVFAEVRSCSVQNVTP